MTRLNAAVRWDFRLQVRNGFYYAAAVVVALLIVVLAQLQLPQDVLAIVLPLVLLQNMTINAFYFMAGLVLLEKGEGTLEGVVVSPLRRGEYLAAKLITLTLLSLVENVLIVLITYGLAVNLPLLLTALVFTTFTFALIGFVLVARYESINAFLFPSVLVTLFLSIPLLDYLGIWQSWLVYLHPTQPVLILLKGAFQPIAGWQLFYGLIAGLTWIILAYGLSRRVFYRFVVLKEGVISKRKPKRQNTDRSRATERSPYTLVNVFRALGPIDVRNIWRDSLLLWMSLMPFVLALIFRWLLPWVRDSLLAQFGFDLQPYYPLLVSYGFVIGVPLMFGVVIGFLLLDERDDHTLIALQVTPLPISSYLIYRVSLPMVISVLLTVLVYPLSGLATLSTGQMLVVALLAAPLAPTFALVLAVIAANKVQGFAVTKGLGVLLLLPFLSYFVASGWQLVAGIIPTYWPLKLYWVLNDGEPYAWVYFGIGLMYQAILLTTLLRRFDRVLHR